MLTYTTLNGEVVNLAKLTKEEQAHLQRCAAAYRAGMAWGQFTRLVETTENPLLRPTSGYITRAVWEHPLFRAVRDLEDRLGIQQGELAAEPGDALDQDPFADEWLPAADAARRTSVTLAGLHKAIARGDVIARPAKPGGKRLVVSARSLARWTPNRMRQAAGRRAARPAAARV
ncbi:MAG: hypothetical protein HY691_19195 [Chloroflexi bacterium]|nr:hypothetical protein [Chloroflexota bacterium]